MRNALDILEKVRWLSPLMLKKKSVERFPLDPWDGDLIYVARKDVRVTHFFDMALLTRQWTKTHHWHLQRMTRNWVNESFWKILSQIWSLMWKTQVTLKNIFASGSPYEKVPLWNRLYTFLDCICFNDSRFILLASEDSPELFLDLCPPKRTNTSAFSKVITSTKEIAAALCIWRRHLLTWLRAVKHIWPYSFLS